MLNKKAISSNRRAFTLIELLIIISIITLLLIVTLVTLNIARTRAKDSAFKTTAKSIQTALTGCCIGSATLLPVAPDATICSTGTETYPEAKSIGNGTVNMQCNGGSFSVTINAGTKNRGTYTSAIITATQITYN